MLNQLYFLKKLLTNLYQLKKYINPLKLLTLTLGATENTILRKGGNSGALVNIKK